jgi:AraC-like DNA-binding protein
MLVKDLEFFHVLTDLNVQFSFNDHRNPSYLASGPLALEVLKQISIFPENNSNSKFSNIINLRNSKGLRFLIAPFEDGLLYLGPYILDEDSPLVLGQEILLGTTIPIRSKEKIDAYTHLLKLKLNNQAEKNDFVDNYVETHKPIIDNSVNTDIDKIDESYRNERYFRQLIATGNKKEIREALKKVGTNDDFLSRIPNNPLRVLKNLSIVLNSLGRLSAEKGGLPPFLLHSISENFALKIEDQTTVKGINHLQREIVLSYCDAVYNYGIENYSAYIVKTCQYILLHLHTKMELKSIAQTAGVNPSYLSRRFKKETGRTIWSYIREKRIMEACWLLSQTKESVTNIALSLGFEDINYFSKVFHKERGINPREYRQKHWRDDFDGIPGSL